MHWLLLFVLIVTTNTFATDSPVSEHPPGTLKFSPVEFYKFNLGGDAGQYTDWEKVKIAEFDGLSTTIEIKEVKGNVKDKWASIARINFYGEGEESARKMLSLIFTVDRKTKRVEAELWRGGDTPRHPIDAVLRVGKPIQFSLVATALNELTLSVDDLTATVKSEFEVKAIRVIGSGVDVTFTAFNLLKKSLAN